MLSNCNLDNMATNFMLLKKGVDRTFFSEKWLQGYNSLHNFSSVSFEMESVCWEKAYLT